MLQVLFHAWERRLADVTKDRVVRPFEWGLDWIPQNGHAPGTAAEAVMRDWVSTVMADTDRFYSAPPTSDYELRPLGDGGLLTFPSALTTPHPSNNTVYCRYFPAKASLKRGPTPKSDPDVAPRLSGAGRAAVLVLPQWNS